MLKKLKPWLINGRIQGAAISIPAGLLGLSIAGVPIMDSRMLVFAIFLFGWHFLGGAHNNILNLPWDLKDESKKNFPLVSGEISLKSARLVIYPGLVIWGMFALLLTNFHPWAVFFIFLSCLSGICYNATCKDSALGKPIFMTLSWASTIAFCYFSTGAPWNLAIAIPYSAGLLQIIHQISVIGEIKEVTKKEANLMYNLGVRVKNDILLPTKKAILWAWGTKISNIFCIFLIWYFISNWWILPILILLSIITFRFLHHVMRYGRYNRSHRVKSGVLVEIGSYLLIVIALEGILGISGMLFFVIFPVVYFCLVNKFLYNTWLTPGF